MIKKILFFLYSALIMVAPVSSLYAQTGSATAKLDVESAAQECALCHFQWMGVEVQSFEAAPEKAAVSEEMCYSCHDGSVQDSRSTTWTHRQHPTNIIPSDKVSIPPDYPLTEEGKVYCGTCHIPHDVSGKPGAGQGFMRESNSNSDMCRLCHVNWTNNKLGSNHSLDKTTIPIPEEIIAAGGKTGEKPNQVICETCHIIHGSPGSEKKLLVFSLEGDGADSSPLCEICHTQNPSRPDYGLGMDTHPVDIIPTKAVIPQSWSREKKPFLSKDGRIVCRSCHLPHFAEPGTPILVEKKIFGKICKKCHPDHNSSGLNELNRGTHPIDVPLKYKKPQSPITAEEGLLTCKSCHRAHNAADNSGVDGTDGKMLVRSNQLSSLCQECHADKVAKSIEEAESSGTHPVQMKPDPERAQISKDFKTLGAITGKAGEIICQSCHRVHQGVPGTSSLIVANVDSALCKQCHVNYLSKSDNQRVVTNHPTEVVPKKASALDVFKENGAQFSRNGGITCSTCHRPHNAVKNSKLQTVDIKGEEFCQICHEDKKTVLSSEHNLQITAPESVNILKQSAEKNGACSACHVMHQGKGPRMWAREINGQENDLNSLCISCHDADKVGEKKQIGEHSHPVNAKFGKNMQQPDALNFYNDLGERTENGKVFCVTCHNPHQWDPFQPKGPNKNVEGTASNSFLRIPNDEKSRLCTSCHIDRFPNNTEHDLSIMAPQEKNIRGQLVAESGVCSACHLIHNAQGFRLWARELSGKGDIFSQLCNSCHSEESIASKKLVKGFSHPVNVKMHKTSNPINFPLYLENGEKNAEGNVYCVTCHNPHQWEPDLDAGGPGVDQEGNMSNSFLRMSNQSRNSPLCQKCHDDRYVDDTAHDMQVISPLEQNTENKTTLETGICSACHVVHNGNYLRMWARKINVDEGDLLSRLCTSCHNEKGLGKTKIPEPYSHPLGATFTRQKELPELPLFDIFGNRDSKGGVSCASCHNPHQWNSEKKEGGKGQIIEGNINTSFLRKPNQDSLLCKSCHLDRRIKGTDHDLRVTSKDTKNKKGFTIEQTGICSACHLPHGGDQLRMWARDRVGEGNLVAQLCKSCHSDGRNAEKKQTGIIYHPIDVPITNPDLKLTLPLFDKDGSYTGKEKGEIACATCHNIHRWDPTSDDYGQGKNTEGDGNNSFLRIRNDLKASLCSECHPEKTVVVGTDHDMSVTAPEEKNILGFVVKESGSCSACHLVHNALDIKLWGKTLGHSDDLNNALCLSCHEEGKVAGKKNTGKYTHVIGTSLLDKGMTTTLPLFTKDGFMAINGNISCATCHNSHIWNPDKPQKGTGKNIEGDGSNSFLRRSNQKTASLCVDCHQKQGFMVGTDHDLATTAPDEINIKGNSALLSGPCSACHLTHNGNDKSRWARPPAEGKDFASRICFSCHNENGCARTKKMGPKPHPMNIKPSAVEMTTSLPLFTKDGQQVQDGEIVCFTCHDIHQWSPEFIKGEKEEEVYILEKDIKPGVIGKVAFIMGNFLYVDTIKTYKAQVGDMYVLYRKGKLYASVKVMRINPIAKTFEAFCEIIKNDLPIKNGDFAIDQNKVQFGLGIEGTGKNSYLRRPNDARTQICLNCHKNKSSILNSDHDMTIIAPDEKNSFGVTPNESGVCSPCHDAHKSTQPYLLSNDLAKKGEPYDRFCTVCHKITGVAKRKTIESHHKFPTFSGAAKNASLQMPGGVVQLYQEITGKPSFEKTSYVTCPTCHNSHQWNPEDPLASKIEEGNDQTSFLRVPSAKNKLCSNCHLSQMEKVFSSIKLREDEIKTEVPEPVETPSEEELTTKAPGKTDDDETIDYTLAAPLITITDFAKSKAFAASQNITIRGTVLDEPPITSAVLIVNGIKEDILIDNGNFQVAKTFNLGSNIFKVIATDEDGNTGYSKEINLIVDILPPEIINYIYPEPKIGSDFFVKIICNESLDTNKIPILKFENRSGESPIIPGGQLSAQYFETIPPEEKKRLLNLEPGAVDSQNPPLNDANERIFLNKTRYYTYREPVRLTVNDLSANVNPGPNNDKLEVLVTSSTEPDGETISLPEKSPGIFKGVFGFETIRTIGFDFYTRIEPDNKLIGIKDKEYFQISYGESRFETTILPNDTFVTSKITLTPEMAGELHLIVRGIHDGTGLEMPTTSEKTIPFHPEEKLGFQETPTIEILEGDSTRVLNINLRLTATGATQMKLSEDENFQNADWIMFQPETPFKLSDGNANKKIFAVFKNEWGYESAVANAQTNYSSVKFNRILSGTLEEDLSLNESDNPVMLKGEVTVPAGKKLTISEGVEILVTSTSTEKGSLTIEGQLEVKGVSGNPVKFKSYEINPMAGDWVGIVFNISGDENDPVNLIEHTEIQQATIGISLSPTNVKIANSNFSDNLTAILAPDNSFAEVTNNTFNDNINYAIVCRYSKPQIIGNKFNGQPIGIWCQSSASPNITKNIFIANKQGLVVEGLSSPNIWGNTFVGNLENAISVKNFSSPPLANNIISENKGVGININRASPMMYHNLIKSNRIGILCTDYYRDFMIMQNNIFDNVESNIKLDNYAQRINAQNNWWGTKDRKIISQLIHDYNENKSLGKVLYLPTFDYDIDIDSQLISLDNVKPEIMAYIYDQPQLSAPFQLTLVANEALNKHVKPDITLITEQGKEIKIEKDRGRFLSTKTENDTYLTPAVMLEPENGGYISIKVERLRDLTGNDLEPVNTEKFYFETAIATKEGNYAKQQNIELLLYDMSAVKMRIGQKNDLADAEWVEFQSPYPLELSPGDGLKTIYVQFEDSKTKQSIIKQLNLTLDTKGPDRISEEHPIPRPETPFFLSLTFNETIDTKQPPKITLIAENGKELAIPQGGEFSKSKLPNDTFTTPSILLPLEMGGQIRVDIKNLFDLAGNPYQGYYYYLDFDTKAPLASEISLRAEGKRTIYVNSYDIELDLDDILDATEMLISSQPNFADTEWIPFKPLYSLSVLPPEGKKMLFFKFRDAVGNTTPPSSFVFTVDTAEPEIIDYIYPDPAKINETFSIALVFNQSLRKSVKPKISLLSTGGKNPSFPDNGSFSSTNQRNDTYTTPSITLTREMAGGLTIKVEKAQDLSGNIMLLSTEETFNLDIIPPVFEQLDVEPKITNQRQVTLFLSATGADEAIISEDPEFSKSEKISYQLIVDSVDPFSLDIMAELLSEIMPNIDGFDSMSIMPKLRALPGNFVEIDEKEKLEEIKKIFDDYDAVSKIHKKEGDWQFFSDRLTYKFSDGDGEKTIYVNVRDAADNRPAEALSVKVTYDTKQPQIIQYDYPKTVSLEEPFRIIIKTDKRMNPSFLPLIVINSPNGETQQVPASGTFSTDENQFDIYTSPEIILSRILGAGEINFTVKGLQDFLGNQMAKALPQSINYNTNAIHGTAIALKEWKFTNSSKVHLVLNSPDAKYMMLSEGEDFTQAKWEPFDTNYQFNITQPDGYITIYAKFKTEDGDESATVKTTTLLDTTPPEIADIKYPTPGIGDDFWLSIQFSEALNPEKLPIVILRSTGQKDPIVPLNGRFTTTGQPNDTYLTPKITLDRFMIGSIEIIVKEAEDVHNNEMNIATEKPFDFKVQWLSLAPVVVKEGEHVNKKDIHLILSPYQSADWVRVSEQKNFPEYKNADNNVAGSVDEWDVFAKEFPYTLVNDPEKTGKTSKMDSFKKKYGHQVIVEGERTIYVLFRSEVVEVVPGNITRTIVTSEAPFIAKVMLDITPPEIKNHYFPRPQIDKPFQVQLTFKESLSSKREPQLAITTDKGERFEFPSGGFFQTNEMPNDTYLSAPLSIETIIKGLPLLEVKGAVDFAGNEMVLASGIKPSGISVIEGLYSANRDINLFLNIEEIESVQISEDPTFEGIPWQPWQENMHFTLSEGDAEKTLYILTKNTNGVISEPLLAKIHLDSQKPDLVSYDFSLPIESDQPFIVRLYFNESLNHERPPQILLQNSTGEISIDEKGMFTTTRKNNDTYVSSPVTIDESLKQGITMTVSSAYDWSDNQMTTKTNLQPTFLKVVEGELINNPNINLITASSGAEFTYMIVSESPNFEDSEWSMFQDEYSFTLSPENGEKTVYIKYKDVQGNITSAVTAKTNLDSQPPQVLFYDFPTPRLGQPFQVLTVFKESLDSTKEPRLIINSSGVDPAVEAKGSFITTNFTNDTYISANIPLLFDNGGDWEIKIVDAFDLAGNKLTEIETLVQNSVLETITSFASSVIIEEGDYIKTSTVHLKLNAEGALLVMLSEDANFYGADWEEYRENKEFDFAISPAEKFAIERGYSLSEEALRKRLYVKFQDLVGQVSEPQYVTATFDLIKPSLVTTTLVKPGDVKTTYNQPKIGVPFSLTLNFSETLDEVNYPSIILTSERGSQLKVPPSGFFLITRSPKDTYITPPITLNESFGGVIKLSISGAEDQAGNTMEPESQTMVMDITPPVITSFKVNEGLLVDSPEIHLSITGQDIDAVKISEDPTFKEDDWQIYQEELLFTLSHGEGPKYIYLLAKDSTGNLAPANSTYVSLTPPLQTSELRGKLERSQKLTAENSPYLVRGELIIPAGIELSIEAGTKIFFARLSFNGRTHQNGKLIVNGVLKSIGTPENPIVLTTSMPGPPITPWGGITFTNFNDKEQSVLKYTVIQDANEAVFCRSSSPTISSCQLSDSLSYAIKATQFSSPRIENTLISNSARSAVFSDRSAPYFTASHFKNNTLVIISKNNYQNNKPVLENCLLENNEENYRGPVEEIVGTGIKPIQPLLRDKPLPGSPTGSSISPPMPTAEVLAPVAETPLLSSIEPTPDKEMKPAEVVTEEFKEPEKIAAKPEPKPESEQIVKPRPEAAVEPEPEPVPEVVSEPKQEVEIATKTKLDDGPGLESEPGQDDMTVKLPKSGTTPLPVVVPPIAPIPTAIPIPTPVPEIKAEPTIEKTAEAAPDTTPPKVVMLKIPDPKVDHKLWRFTVNYSEKMMEEKSPAILLKDDNNNSKQIASGNWKDKNTFVAKLDNPGKYLDGEISIEIEGAMDQAGNKQINHTQELFYFDIRPPQLRSFNILEGIETSHRDIAVLIEAEEATHMRLANQAKFKTATWEAFKDKFSLTLPDEEGRHKIKLQLKDRAGNKTETYSLTIVYRVQDITPPALTAFTIKEGEETGTRNITLLIKTDDASFMRLGTQPKISGSTWQSFNREVAFELPDEEGKHNIYLQLKDKAENLTEIFSIATTYRVPDTTPPALTSFTIREGEETATRKITLLIETDDAAFMRLGSEPDLASATWKSFRGETTYTLPEKEAKHNIYLQLKDRAENLTDVFSTSVLYRIPDTKLPYINYVNINGAAASGEDFTLSLVFSESLNSEILPDIQFFIGENKFWIDKTGNFEATENVNDTYVTPSINLQNKPSGKVSIAITQARDISGNIMKPFLHSLFTFDISPPEIIEFTATGGEVVTESKVSLRLDAKDAFVMRLSEDSDFSDAEWQPFKQLFELDLSEEEGGKLVYLQLQDNAGNFSKTVSIPVKYQPLPPTDETPPQISNIKIIGRAERGKPFRLHLEFNESINPESKPNIAFTNNKGFEMKIEARGKYTKAFLDNDTYLTSSITLDNRIEPHVYLKVSSFEDLAGNQLAIREQKLFDLDLTPPQLNSFYCEDGSVIEKLQVTLIIEADDAALMRIGEQDDFSNAPWVDYQNEIVMTLSPKPGTKTINLQLADKLNNQTSLFMLDLKYLPPLPKNHLKGSLSEDRTLTMELSPYVVHGLLVVEKKVTLTIEKGVEIQFAPLSENGQLTQLSGLLIKGSLNALGESNRRIIFTSNNKKNKQPGDWDGITFKNGKAGKSQFKFCLVEYAVNGITCDASSPLISNCTIKSCKDSGISVVNFAGPRILNSEISDNSIGIDARRAFPRIEDSHIYNNDIGIRSRNNYLKKSPQLLNVLLENNSTKDIIGIIQKMEPASPKTPALKADDISKPKSDKPKTKQAVKKPVEPGLVQPLTELKETVVPQMVAPAPEAKTPLVVKKPAVEKDTTPPTILAANYKIPQADQPFKVEFKFSESLDIQLPPTVKLVSETGPSQTFPKGQFMKNKVVNDTYTVYIKALDKSLTGPLSLKLSNAQDVVGNIAKIYTSKSFSIQTSPPKLHQFTLFEGPEITMPLVNVRVQAEDATMMMFSEEANFKHAIWQTFKESTTFELSSDDGQKTIFIKLKNKDGVESMAGQVNTFLNLFEGARINGEIKESTTLSAAKSPYLIKGLLTIPSGVVLRIEAGTVLKFTSLTVNSRVVQRGRVVVRGRLLAQGTSKKRIVFTSSYPQPKPDDWDGIRFENTSADQPSLLESCVVEYANNGIICSTSSPLFNKCEIRYNRNHGISLFNFSEIRLFKSVIANNGKSGINCNKSGPIIALNTFSNNEFGITVENTYTSHPKVYQNKFINNNRGEISGKVITQVTPPSLFTKTSPTTPDKADEIKQISQVAALGKTVLRGSLNTKLILSPEKGPYVVMGRYVVTRFGQLTILPGVKLIFAPLVEKKMEESGALVIEGHLIAKGRRNFPITFTSVPTSQKAGAWKGIQINNESSGQVSVIEYAVIENADSGIFIKMSPAQINFNTIRNNKNGIYCSNFSSASISNNKIVDNINYGILCRQSTTEINSNVITRNEIGIKLTASEPKPRLNNNKVTGNFSENILTE